MTILAGNYGTQYCSSLGTSFVGALEETNGTNGVEYTRTIEVKIPQPLTNDPLILDIVFKPFNADATKEMFGTYTYSVNGKKDSTDRDIRGHINKDGTTFELTPEEKENSCDGPDTIYIFLNNSQSLPSEQSWATPTPIKGTPYSDTVREFTKISLL